MSSGIEPFAGRDAQSHADSIAGSPEAGSEQYQEPVQIRTGRGTVWHRYVVAGLFVDSDVAIPALSPFRFKGAVPLVKLRNVEPVEYTSAETVRGWTGGAWRDVHVSHGADSTAIAVEDSTPIYIDHSGLIDARGVRAQRGVVDSFGEEVLLGPCLACALAARSVFLLHASAVVNADGKVLLFAANSGTGKSTIARELAHSDDGLRRVADDIVALTMVDSKLVCLPHFPQLKLGGDELAEIASLPERLEVSSLFAASVDQRGGPMITPLGDAELATQFVRHGVGLRVLDTSAVANHFEFASTATGSARGYALSWSHRPAALWALGAALKSI